MSIIAKYNFARGNSQDLSGNAYHGTDTDVSYANGGAVFNGSTSRIDLPTSFALLSQYTIISYSKPLTADPLIIFLWFLSNSNIDSKLSGIWLYQNKGVIDELVDINYRLIVYTTDNYELNKNLQLCGTVSLSNILSVYKNGLLSNTATASRRPSFSPQAVRIGSGLWWTTKPAAYNPYNGTIYDITVYNHELSPSEIKNNYAYNKGFYNG
jgi:hypothetical protein